MFNSCRLLCVPRTVQHGTVQVVFDRVSHQSARCAEEGDVETKQYSRGHKHSVLCKQAWVARQVRQASQLTKLSSDRAQNLVKTVFSEWSRGKNSAATGRVYFG